MRRRFALLFALLFVCQMVWAAAYTSTQSGDFDDVATWGGGGYPSAEGDTFTICAGHTVLLDYDTVNYFSASDIHGLLSIVPGSAASSALRIKALLTIKNTGELRIGNAASPIPANKYAGVFLNAAADNTELVQIDNGGKLTTCGTATNNLASEAWASCYTTLTAQANSGQANATISDATMASKAVTGQRFLVQGTSSYNQDEIMEVLSVAGSTITFNANFTNTHASGAYVVPLWRNIFIRSVDPAKRGYIDNDNTAAGNVNLKLTSLRDVYDVQGSNTVNADAWDYCVLDAPRFGVRFKGTVQRSVLAGGAATGYLCYSAINPRFEQCIFGNHSSGAIYTCDNPFVSDSIILGIRYLFFNPYGTVRLSGTEFAGAGTYVFYNLYGDAEMVNCDASAVGTLVYVLYGSIRSRCSIHPATIATQASVSGRGAVYLQDNGGVLGAAKTVYPNIGTIERQNTVARSGYAAELTPASECSSDEPLEIEWDIPCEHGDVLTVSVYVRVNATYGTTHDPTLVLDPDSLYGCNNTSSQNVTAADTWTQLTAAGTADLGGGKGTVNVVLRVPYYVSGGKVYVDDFSVTKAAGE